MLIQKNILLIEDDDDLLDIIEDNAKNSPYKFNNILKAANISQAKEVLGREEIHCIVLDINLNGENGGEIIQYLKQLPRGTINKTSPIIVTSGLINQDFSKKYSEHFSAVMPKPYDTPQLIQTIHATIKSFWHNEGIQPVPATLPFPVVEVSEKVDKVLKKLNKNKNLKKLLDKMPIERNSNLYMNNHIGLIINICAAILSHMDWNSEKMLEKFIYAAYLHDCLLIDYPQLAKIQKLSELEAIKDEIGAKNYELVFNHPKLTAQLVRENSGIPQDVDIIIEQHHCFPTEEAFPMKIDHKIVAPLAALFIVAHDFALYIMEHPDWSIPEFLHTKTEVYRGPQFAKVVQALKMLTPVISF